MTSAPLSQQRLLIDLQSLDSRLARLRHERKHLPVLSRIKDTVERLKANRREAALADGALAEARKGAARSEDEVDQVTRRAAILRERLSSGARSRRRGGRDPQRRARADGRARRRLRPHRRRDRPARS